MSAAVNPHLIDVTRRPHRDDPLAWLAHADQLDDAGRAGEASEVRWRGRMLEAAREAVALALAGGLASAGDVDRVLPDGSRVSVVARPLQVTLYLSHRPGLELMQRFHLKRSLLGRPGYLFKRVRELWEGRRSSVREGHRL